MEGTRKGYLFREQWYVKGEGVGLRGGASPYKHLFRGGGGPPPELLKNVRITIGVEEVKEGLTL